MATQVLVTATSRMKLTMGSWAPSALSRAISRACALMAWRSSFGAKANVMVMISVFEECKIGTEWNGMALPDLVCSALGFKYV